MEPNVLSAKIMFTDVVKRMEKMSNSNDMAFKKIKLRNFFDAMFEMQQKFRAENGPQANASFYPFLRIFLPEYDETERGPYGIQTKKLGQLFVKALAINAKSDTAKKLTNLQGRDTDYGDIVFEVMKSRSPENGTLTVYEVNEYLDLIADHFEQNEQRKIDNEIARMLLKMSALDRKWLTRILLKKLKLGLGKQYILQTYHQHAPELFNKSSHLSRVCELLESNLPIDAIRKRIIELFKPIRSMLCERGYISNINGMLSKHAYYLETKMDGERYQLHVNGTEFKYFSRNCKEEMTQIFGANSTTGLYSPYLYHQLNGKVRNAIFDGEMMVWDREAETFLKKAENFTAKHLTKNDTKLIPCYCIYDLIYVDGECLIDKPYAERIRKLKTIITEQKGSLMLCERIKLRDGAHFLELFNKAFDSNEEGVVIKQEDSKYRPGQREKGGWFKMKPDYENNLISDFDLLIIGGYYNEKRTAVDSFLLAVFKKTSIESDAGVFYSVCKIRNGLKRSQFAEILDKLQPYRHEIGGRWQKLPDNIEWANANPDFWFDPKKSIVLKIKASELTQTTTYRTSHSFRFPRVMEIRYDKMWYDTCTLNEFQTFCASNSKVEKLTKRHATANDLTSGATVPKRQRGAVSKTLPPVTSASNEMTVDNVCQGREFHILGGDKQLEAIVKRHGGKVVGYPNLRTFVIIAPNPKSINAGKFIEKKQYNIATKEWLIEALGSDQPLTELKKFTAADMVFATEELKEQFDAELDENDDFETPPINFENLSVSVEQMDTNDQSNFEDNEPNEDEIDIFGHVPHMPNDVIVDQPEAGEKVAVPMDEAPSNDQPIDQAVVEPIVLIDEPQEMEQDAALIFDSVYEYDTQLIEPVINEESVAVANKVEAMDDVDPTQMFSPFVGYFYHDESIAKNIDITFAECAFIGGGGVCMDTPDDIRESSSRLTHIFVDTDSLDHAKLKGTVKSFGTENIDDIVFLRYQWVSDCDAQKKRICDTSYKVEL
ncbi:DNA ligase 4 [Sitodiplosis mosellana]|uniref:DNA ligase 4 n=1 Tax=Sitodiplosis mosellana TaxID=263140 RepID=UPI0024443CB0|nr:DNA ligase 4 [Sitodiplosis mosellana]